MWKDSETNIDYLGFTYILNALNEIIKNKKLMPSSIGVYGYWGSGKSSLIEMSFRSMKKEQKTLCIKFNGWKFEGYEDAKTALMGTIMDSIEDYINESTTLGIDIKQTLLAKAKGIFERIDKLKLAKTAGSLMLGTLNPALIPFITGATGIIQKGNSFLKEDIELDEDKIFIATRREIDSFQSEFAELVDASGLDRVVVYIDELDRCNSDTILSTLEAIRLFLFISTTVFVIGADERHVRNAVLTKFDSNQKNHIGVGKEYLEKMIQYPIRIPNLDVKSMEIYVLLLFLERDLDIDDFEKVLKYITNGREDDVLGFSINSTTLSEIVKKKTDFESRINIAKNLSYILTNNLDGNPRQVKRFLNTLEIRKLFAKTSKIVLNDSIMLKLMILEYFRPEIHTFLQFEYEKSKENLLLNLELIEEQGIEKSELFSSYKEDNWFILWAKLKPQLSKIDLLPYFYFSREGVSILKSINDILPPVVEDILKSIRIGGHLNIGAAFRLLDELTDVETSILLRETVHEESSNAKMSLDGFRLINEIIIQKPHKFPECEKILKVVNGKDLLNSYVLVIQNTIKMIKPSLKSNYLDVCTKWDSENSKISIIGKGN